MVGPMRKSLLSKAVTAVCATIMCLGVTACGGNSSAKSDKSNSDSSSSSEKIGMHQIAGVTAKGELVLEINLGNNYRTRQEADRLVQNADDG